jgi:hypothetical protein
VQVGRQPPPPLLLRGLLRHPASDQQTPCEDHVAASELLCPQSRKKVQRIALQEQHLQDSPQVVHPADAFPAAAAL